MYIAGQNCPNFRVYRTERKNNAEFFSSCFKQTVQLALEMKLATLGTMSLQAAKFKANSSKYKAMSYKYRQEKEVAFTQEIDALIAQANDSDTKEDAVYLSIRGDEIPEELKLSPQRLETIKAAKRALEVRELVNNPGKTVDDWQDKVQISFADFEPVSWAKTDNLITAIMAKSVSIANIKSLLVNMSANVPTTNRKSNLRCLQSLITQVKFPLR